MALILITVWFLCDEKGIGSLNESANKIMNVIKTNEWKLVCVRTKCENVSQTWQTNLPWRLFTLSESVNFELLWERLYVCICMCVCACLRISILLFVWLCQRFDASAYSSTYVYMFTRLPLLSLFHSHSHLCFVLLFSYLSRLQFVYGVIGVWRRCKRLIQPRSTQSYANSLSHTCIHTSHTHTCSHTYIRN